LHDLEVTYSLTLPHGHDWLHGSANRLYERAHQAVIAAVGVRAQLAGDAGCVGAGSCGESSRHGPFFCFARRYALDVVVQDTNAVGGFAKLAGSAQRRTRGAVLQHGSIILASRFTQQPCATWSGVGGPSDYEQAVRRLVDAFAAILGPRVSFGAFTPDEKHRATALEAKYASPAWTRQR
jgi:lipoate-protein ligase A